MLWFRIPPKVYFKKGCLPTALAELEGCKRAFVVTDAPLFALGLTQRVTDALGELDIDSEVFFDVQPDPDIETVQRGAARMQSFQPDVIESLIESLQTLKRQLDIPDSIQAAGVPEEEFLARLDEVSEEAFDDQCTGANPRYPLMSEIRQLLLNAYYGSSAALVAGRTTCGAAA